MVFRDIKDKETTTKTTRNHKANYSKLNDCQNNLKPFTKEKEMNVKT